MIEIDNNFRRDRDGSGEAKSRRCGGLRNPDRILIMEQSKKEVVETFIRRISTMTDKIAGNKSQKLKPWFPNETNKVPVYDAVSIIRPKEHNLGLKLVSM